MIQNSRMKYTKEIDKGYPNIQLSFDVEFEEFYRVADILQKELNVVFYSTVDDFDSLYWHFKFEGGDLTLHYNTFLGISIYPSLAKNFSQGDEKAIERLMEKLSDIL